MIRRVLILSVVALLVLPAVSARGQNSGPVTREEFQSAIADLKVQIQSLKSPSMAAPGIAAADAAVAAAEIKDLKQRLYEAEVTIGQIAKSVNTPGGKMMVADLERNMQYDPDSRRRIVDTVMHDAARGRGVLRIRNDMTTGQSILVNGTTWVYAPAQSSTTVDVPSGTATTDLPGEGTKSWFVGLPNYTQDIIIAPAVQSPLAPAGPQYGPWRYNSLTGAWSRDLAYP